MSISSMASAIKEKEAVIGERVMSSKAVTVYWPAVKGIGSKIPIGKHVLIILGVAIFAVCLTLLSTAYVSQVNKHNELSDELDSVEGQTATINAEEFTLLQTIADSDYEIARLDNDIADIQEKLTYPLWLSSIFEDLLDVAEAYSIEITDDVDVTILSSTVEKTEEIAGKTYRAISINMKVTGTESNIYQFVENLKPNPEDLSQGFSTGVLNSVNINMDDEEAGGSPSATMILTIYSV